jgi:hypothetical protein|tara:strand:- start:5218 stop:5748 length:531 start_codon:yes stop_codon:yes gene_type:complete
MGLQISADNSCNQINIIADYYSASTTTALTFAVLDAQGNNILNITSPSFNVTATSGVLSIPIFVTALTQTRGVMTVVSYINGAEKDRQTTILNCDIDCCLAKLTNELIDCACDCARCSKTLAKAQKVMLLLKAAEYAVNEANNYLNLTLMTGYITDAHNKYTKAREVCDNSCGCDC